MKINSDTHNIKESLLQEQYFNKSLEEKIESKERAEDKIKREFKSLENRNLEFEEEIYNLKNEKQKSKLEIEDLHFKLTQQSNIYEEVHSIFKIVEKRL